MTRLQTTEYVAATIPLMDQSPPSGDGLHEIFSYTICDHYSLFVTESCRTPREPNPQVSERVVIDENGEFAIWRGQWNLFEGSC